MSFTLTAWPQPADRPWPSDVMQAQAQLTEVWERPGPAPEPRFLQLARALAARWPDTDEGSADVYDHGLDILEQRPDNDGAYNIGLWADGALFDESFNHLVVQANDLGLHVMDGQNGVVYLANGDVLQLGPACAATHTARLDDAVSRKDWPAAWKECRRLASRRLPEALTVWALLVTQGRCAPPHAALGAALAQLAGTDPAKDRRVQYCLDKVPMAQRPWQAQLLAELRASPDLLQAVDAELQRAAPPAAAAAATAVTTTDATLAAATQEAAHAQGVDPALVQKAIAGSSSARFDLALKLLALKPSQARLAAQWLELSAAQGQHIAKAVLGDVLLRGPGGLPVDMARGLALLEEAVAEQDMDAMNFLADFLYEKSVRRLPDGTLQKRTDAASQRHLSRVPQLLMRSAAAGSKKALFWLAVRLWDEIGVPRDDVAAKAVMQLARTRSPQLCAQQPETLALLAPTPADSAAVMALTRELGADLRRLPELLNARLAARATVAPSTAAAVPSPRSAPRTAGPATVAAEEDVRADASGFRLHAGHLALGLCIAGSLLLLLFIPSLGRGGFRAIAVGLGLIGAWGVWRTTADGDWGGATRLLASGLALLPGLGFVACVAVLLLAVRAANT